MYNFGVMNNDNEQQGQGKFTASARKSRLSSSFNSMGKIPPQATDLEEAVLGALMLEKDALPIRLAMLQIH